MSPLEGRRVGVLGLTWLSFWIPPRPTGLGGTRSERLAMVRASGQG